MGAKENIEVVERMRETTQAGNWDAFGELLADDVAARMAGVPAAMGGVMKGRDAVVAFFKANTATGGSETKTLFADDNHACVINKVSGTQFPGNEYLKGGGAPYSTYQCVVHTFRDGKVADITNYVNWLDVYVQSGVIDAGSLLAQ